MDRESLGCGVIVLGLVAILVFMISFGMKNTREITAWSNKCIVDGGIVEQNGWGFIPHYDCFKDGVIINYVE